MAATNLAGGAPMQSKREVPRHRVSHALRTGCLLALLLACAGLGALVVALESGPVSLGLAGGTSLRIGSDNFVLSNYSFQNGTTYFLDLDGNGVRNIVQVHYLSDSHSVELVLHYANRQSEGEHHILNAPLP